MKELLEKFLEEAEELNRKLDRIISEQDELGERLTQIDQYLKRGRIPARMSALVPTS